MSESESESEIITEPNLSTQTDSTLESSASNYQDIDDQSSLNNIDNIGNESATNLDTDLNASLSPISRDEGDLTAEVASQNNMDFSEPLSFDDNVGTGIDTDLATGSEASLQATPPETNSSNQTGITIEITKDKLDELLTKISEETINYLSLLIKFMEKKTQFDTNNEKINKTIQELTKIKDDIIKILTENKITSNSFDPSSSAQKSQYAEMIMAALGLAAVVTGGKRSNQKSKKREKKHKKTKKTENKHYNHKTKKHRRKKCKTKGQMVKINNDQNNNDNN
jgi:hypothetical protein